MPHRNITIAKTLRGRMTDTERRLWTQLRAHRLARWKFKRQQPLGPYIVDFVCLRARLVIEVDGGQHQGNEADRVRDAWLKEQGFRVLRFWDNEVLTESLAVLEKIAEALSPSPPPLSHKGRGKTIACPEVLGFPLSPCGRGPGRGVPSHEGMRGVNQPVEFDKGQKFEITNGSGRARERGIALITAVLIVAIVATVSAQLSLGQQVWVRQAQNLNDRAQADTVAKAAYIWAITILNEDTKKGTTTDDLTEDWARPLPPLPVEGGAIQGRIIDAQGLFNLNNLVRGGNPSTPDIDVFQRLLRNLGLDPNLSGAVVDWIDSNSQTGAAGAEDTEYLTLQPPYRAANQLIASVEELRLIRGFDAAAMEKLRPLVVALDKPTKINVNTAPPAVLSALFANLPLSKAEQLVMVRDKAPYKTVAEFATQAGQALTEKAELAVTSSYFLVVVETQFGRLARRSQALVQRGGGGDSKSSPPVPPGKNTTKILWTSHIL